MNVRSRLPLRALGLGLFAAAAIVALSMPGHTSVPAPGTLSFESGPRRVHLLELYTSEGCSSCPSAERWLASLQDHSGLWSEFVPVSFHVTYWDRLGWKDPYAREVYTERQYWYARAWRTSAYTPCIALSGEEWRGWFRGGRLPSDPRPIAGNLRMTLRAEDLEISFVPGVPAREIRAHVAALGFSLGSDVRAGENRGRHLIHNFVALDYQQVEATREERAFRVVLPASFLHHPDARAVAAWVSRGADAIPLQATGGWLR